MELRLDHALQKAIEAHKAGQVQEADRLYTDILKAQPKHPDANHNMGVLAVGLGKVQEALPFFKLALEANPNTAQFWLSYIDALINLGQIVDAKSVFDQAKSNGANGDGLDHLEQRLKASNENPTKAAPMIQGLEQVQPNILDTLKLDQAIKLAKNKSKEGSSEEAKRIYQDVLVKFPKNKRAIDGIKTLVAGPVGKASKFMDPPQDQLQPLINLYSQGQLQQALGQANVLLQQFPHSSVLYNIFGVVYKELGQLDASIGAYKKALSIKPDYADVFNNMGNALKEKGKLEEAIEAYKKALTIKPNHAEAYNNMGLALKEQGKLEEAIEAYKKALLLKPSYTEVYHNMGHVLRAQGKQEEAIEAYKKDGSSESQIHILKCLYKQDERDKLYDQLDYLINQNENNAVIGSYISRSQIRYGVNRANPFCNDPLKYVLHTNLTNHCDFENTFVKGAADILRGDIVQNRMQSLLTNGIQTTGNVFNQIDNFTDKIQSIIYSEIENYRMYFKDSPEGLIQSWPTNYQIYGWLVSMKNGGKLAAHMHDKGWISGSIYINVPPKSKKDSGNLVVTTDETKHEKGETENSKSIDVVTGSLCLFPSSLLHYTIPFEADENRIVLAFDVIPK